MALLGDLQTTNNSGTAAEVHSLSVDGTTVQGTGASGSPIAVKDAGITNAKLANMASKRYKGRTTSGTGVPEDLTAAQMQADLSIDDLITLSGVAEGAADLGTFTGSTIPDSQTIKAALQSLETAVESAGGGITITRTTDTSSGNANNYTRISYVVLTGSPTITVTRGSEGGTTPTIAITVAGGTIRVVKVFNTYENTNAGTATLDVTINGVGSNEIDAVPMVQKILHNQAFTSTSPASNCQYDIDNTPAVQPHSFSSGVIKLRLTNLPAGDRYAFIALWSEN